MRELVLALRLLRRALAQPVVSTGAGLVGLVLAGFGALVLAWRGVAATQYVPFQVPFLLSGAVAGLGLVVLGLGLLDAHVNRALAASERGRRDAVLREAVALVPLVQQRAVQVRAESGGEGSRA